MIRLTIYWCAKGQFVLPKAVREHLKLLPGCKVNVTVDERGRLILTPALHEPEELFADRPDVKKVVSLEEMDRAMADAVRGGI
jgi:AbrB family looped-hinge helix DNA binding protein